MHKTKREIEELVAEVAPRPEVPASLRKLPRARRSTDDQLGPNVVPGATIETRSTGSAPAASSAPTTSAAPAASDVHGPEGGDSVPAQPVLEPIAPARYKVSFTASAELRDKLCRAKALLRHKDTPAKSRHVPAAVKRVVFERDSARCTFVDEATGRRCACTDPGQLEFHHVEPFAPQPVAQTPRVADPRGAAGALPGCTTPAPGVLQWTDASLAARRTASPTLRVSSRCWAVGSVGHGVP